MKRVARKEGKENEVEKDVTGWTEVMWNKRKKMVQIFDQGGWNENGSDGGVARRQGPEDPEHR